MEIKTGLSGQILPDETFDEGGRKLNNNPRDNRKYMARAIIFCLGIAIGIGLFFSFYYFFIRENQEIYEEKEEEKREELQESESFSLEVDSEPAGASLYVDGSSLSKFTPASLADFADGSHLLQLFYGNRKWEAELGVKGGSIESIKASINSAESAAAGESKNTDSIFLSSNPAGAKIFVNNKDIQKITPFELTDLNPGNYLISLQAEGFVKWSEEISIENSRRLEILAVLEKEKTFSESDNNINSGWRKYENNLYGIRAEIPAGWKIGELPKNVFDIVFAEYKDNEVFNGADIAIVFLPDYEKISIAASISSKDKSQIISELSEGNFKKLDEESLLYGADLFEKEDARVAVIKESSNPYTFLISFYGCETAVSEDLFSKFLLAFQIIKPEIF